MLEAARLVAEITGPWMLHHTLPAAVAAGSDLGVVLDSALAALMVCHGCCCEKTHAQLVAGPHQLPDRYLPRCA